jgi:two-component system, oxyanion-binding sensor
MGAEQSKIRIGLLRLTDAAPVILAQAQGLFAAEGLSVELQIEASWANLADKLAYGLLDAAILLPPLALAMSMGLRNPGAELIVPMGLSLDGNSITLAPALAEHLLEGGRPDALTAGCRLRSMLTGRSKPVLAVVHAFSTHDLLLRYWLAAAGIDPVQAIDWAIVPPAEMVAALAAGRIDGFCAGAPWGWVAAEAGAGRTVAVSSGIWQHHPEKCLAVRRPWAEAQPQALQAVLRALLQAARRCDDPAEAPALARLLAEPGYIGVPVAAIAASLAGGGGGEVDRSLFAAHAATYPARVHALWFLGQMARWRELPAGLDRSALVDRVYRPDLHAQALLGLGMTPPAGPESGPFCDQATMA